MTAAPPLSSRIVAFVVVGLAYLTRFNKLLGAIAGGGLITLLVGLHVIPASVGNTLLAVITAVGAAIGTFVAAANKAMNTGPDVPEGDEAVASEPDPTLAEIGDNEPALTADDPDQPLAGQPPSAHLPERAAPDA